MKLVKDIIAGIKWLAKYGSFIMVLLSILGYASKELESWQNNEEKSKAPLSE